jgi:ribose transport system substrate-binding protein
MKPEENYGLIAWVATDVTQYGKDAANAMADKLGCSGPIAVTQNTFNDTENEAARSFTEQMKTRCPDVEVFPPEIEGGEESAAIAKAGAILTAHPEIKGAFGTTGGSPTTWAKALEQSGHKPGDVVVIGMDYTRPNLDLVKAGWVFALVGQPIYEETYRCAELLIDHLKGKKVEFANSYPSPIITIKEIDKYYEYAKRVEESLNK